MYAQGQAFRTRYLGGKSLSGNSSDDSAIGSALIQNIGTGAIDNDQLAVYSTDDQWISGGALAFLQALYPPAAADFNPLAGGSGFAHNYVDGTNTTYPMNGYQYPNIQTLSSLDTRRPR